MFILDGDGRDKANFDRYRAYIDDNDGAFPPGALALARSEWYFGFHDHRAPHDSRLERAELSETPADPASEWKDRSVSLVVSLRGAFGDGVITMRYPRVFSYDLEGLGAGGGHRDWRYDELRLNGQGQLVHEIEWWGRDATARWIITADDVEHTWTPDPVDDPA